MPYLRDGKIGNQVQPSRCRLRACPARRLHSAYLIGPADDHILFAVANLLFWKWKLIGSLEAEPTTKGL
jgi:hypothetical protein